MEAIQRYFLMIVVAAVITALSIQLLGKTNAYATIIQTICGVFLVITVLSPITTISTSKIYNYFKGSAASSESYVADGMKWKETQTSSYIKSRAESYILDKAASLGLSLNAEVELSESDPPIPIAVKLKGNANPYLKQRLQQLINEDLGIKLEAQLWSS